MLDPFAALKLRTAGGNDVGRHIASRDNRNLTSGIQETPTLMPKNHCREISRFRPRDMATTGHEIRLSCVRASRITTGTTRVLVTHCRRGRVESNLMVLIGTVPLDMPRLGADIAYNLTTPITRRLPRI